MQFPSEDEGCEMSDINVTPFVDVMNAQTYVFNAAGHNNGSGTNMGFVSDTYTFTASATNTTLKFASLDAAASAWGPMVANIQVSAPTPEPEQWAMMLLGMPLIGLAVRRKQVLG
jgi:hypothetical protein